jgi:Periplasmic copper-binding protein (NosD)/Right handed beta helix region
MDRRLSKLGQPARITLICGLPLMLLALPGRGVAATLTVNCDAGGKVQAAVDAAHPGDTIQISGACYENVRFNDEVSRITLDGNGLATIHGVSSTVNTITIRGRGITITGFTITGGRNGVGVLMGGSATIQGNTIQETAENGINVAQHSYARIIGNTIQLNPDAGIRVLENSSARIGFLDLGDPAPVGNVIRRNGAVGGVLVQRSAGASLVGNTIGENDGPGVSVSDGSHADLASNQIDGNGTDGVVVTQNSDVQLGDEPGILDPPNDTTLPNGGVGLRCSYNSSAGGSLGTLTGVQGDRQFDSSCSNGSKIK